MMPKDKDKKGILKKNTSKKPGEEKSNKSIELITPELTLTKEDWDAFSETKQMDRSRSLAQIGMSEAEEDETEDSINRIISEYEINNAIIILENIIQALKSNEIFYNKLPEDIKIKLNNLAQDIKEDKRDKKLVLQRIKNAKNFINDIIEILNSVPHLKSTPAFQASIDNFIIDALIKIFSSNNIGNIPAILKKQQNTFSALNKIINNVLFFKESIILEEHFQNYTYNVIRDIINGENARFHSDRLDMLMGVISGFNQLLLSDDFNELNEDLKKELDGLFKNIINALIDTAISPSALEEKIDDCAIKLLGLVSKNLGLSIKFQSMLFGLYENIHDFALFKEIIKTKTEKETVEIELDDDIQTKKKFDPMAVLEELSVYKKLTPGQIGNIKEYLLQAVDLLDLANRLMRIIVDISDHPDSKIVHQNLIQLHSQLCLAIHAEALKAFEAYHRLSPDVKTKLDKLLANNELTSEQYLAQLINLESIHDDPENIKNISKLYIKLCQLMMVQKNKDYEYRKCLLFQSAIIKFNEFKNLPAEIQESIQNKFYDAESVGELIKIVNLQYKVAKNKNHYYINNLAAILDRMNRWNEDEHAMKIDLKHMNEIPASQVYRQVSERYGSDLHGALIPKAGHTRITQSPKQSEEQKQLADLRENLHKKYKTSFSRHALSGDARMYEPSHVVKTPDLLGMVHEAIDCLINPEPDKSANLIAKKLKLNIGNHQPCHLRVIGEELFYLYHERMPAPLSVADVYKEDAKAQIIYDYFNDYVLLKNKKPERAKQTKQDISPQDNIKLLIDQQKDRLASRLMTVSKKSSAGLVDLFYTIVKSVLEKNYLENGSDLNKDSFHKIEKNEHLNNLISSSLLYKKTTTIRRACQITMLESIFNKLKNLDESDNFTADDLQKIRGDIMAIEGSIKNKGTHTDKICYELLRYQQVLVARFIDKNFGKVLSEEPEMTDQHRMHD